MICKTPNCKNEVLEVTMGLGVNNSMVIDQLKFKFCDNCLCKKLKQAIKEVSE